MFVSIGSPDVFIFFIITWGRRWRAFGIRQWPTMATLNWLDLLECRAKTWKALHWSYLRRIFTFKIVSLKDSIPYLTTRRRRHPTPRCRCCWRGSRCPRIDSDVTRDCQTRTEGRVWHKKIIVRVLFRMDIFEDRLTWMGLSPFRDWRGKLLEMRLMWKPKEAMTWMCCCSTFVVSGWDWRQIRFGPKETINYLSLHWSLWFFGFWKSETIKL